MLSRNLSEVHKKGLHFMSDLYERIDQLCKERNINITTMCKESGASRGSLTDLKFGRKQSLSIDTLTKIASYFGVSVDYLAGKEKAPTPKDERNIVDAKAAFFDGYGDDLSEEEKDELWEDARIYAKFKAQQKK